MKYPDKSGYWWLNDKKFGGWNIVLVQKMPFENLLFQRIGMYSESNVRDYDSWGEFISFPSED